MISVALAHRLRAAGLRWHPSPGDRFVLPDRGMDDESFVLSNMTIEVHEFPTGQVIGFNGVAEWALDSVAAEEALWMPAEHQLRGMLGGLFRSLRRDGDAFVVELALPSGPWSAADPDPAEAYGLAVEHVLTEVASRDDADSPVAAGP